MKGIHMLCIEIQGTHPKAEVINEVSFNASISACEKAGQWQFALFLLELLELHSTPGKLELKVSTLGSLLKAVYRKLSTRCCDTGRPLRLSVFGPSAFGSWLPYLGPR